MKGSIKVGDKFLCIKDVVMIDIKYVTYIKDKIYTSEIEGCLTNERGDKNHHWDKKVNEFFKKVDSSMKSVKINIPEGYEIDKEESSFEEIVFKKKILTLPKTWKELELVSGEYICANGDINPSTPVKTEHANRNIVPKGYARKILVLCQLLQLRDKYNAGWKPDYTKDYDKYVIFITGTDVYTGSTTATSHVLAFKTIDLRNEFFNNFEKLILEAGDLI